MKFRHFMLLVAATALVASPAFAVERIFGPGNLVTTSYTPSAPGQCTTFDPTVPEGEIHPTTGCPTGFSDWVAPETYTIIEDGGGGGATPTLVYKQVKSQNYNGYPCSSTSNTDGLGNVPGCVVEIWSDSATLQSGAGNLVADSIVAGSTKFGPTGWTVVWPDLSNEGLLDQGKGQYCVATCDDETSLATADPPRVCTPEEVSRMESEVTSVCKVVLDLRQGSWYEDSQLLVPLPALDTGIWEFNADMTEYYNPGPFRYFAIGSPGDPLYNIVYGRYRDEVGVAPYAVPLAPIGALALGASLAYMGVTALRRKK